MTEAERLVAEIEKWLRDITESGEVDEWLDGIPQG